MTLFALITVVLQSLLYVVLAITIYVRNDRARLNKAFSRLSFMLGLWILFSYFGGIVDNKTLSQVLIKLDYTTGNLLILAFWYFTEVQLSSISAKIHTLLKPFLIRILTIEAGIVSLSILLTDFLIEVRLENDLVIIEEHIMFVPLYLLPTTFLVVLGMVNLFRAVHHSQGMHRQRSRIVLVSFLLPVTVATMSFLIFQQLGVNQEEIRVYQQFSNLSFVFFISGTTYAIVRHQLFDFRKFFAESVAYLLLLASFVLLYGGAIFLVARFLLGDSNFSLLEQVIYINLAIILAVTYQPLKRVFDRVTNQLFFRDSYDSQAILDRLGSLLATEINLQKIIIDSSQLINEALKPSFIRFAVFKDGETYVDHLENTERKRALIRPEVDEFDDILIVRDDASRNERQFLDSYEAEILLKLRTNEETVGVILLGPKQSGTVYSKQDLDLLTISEKELAIAVQNSRYLEQIQQFNIKLQKEVDDATAELRDTNKKLKALDEAKDEFISMASHQLRTPLTSVKGYISMVMDGDTGKVEPGQKKLLEEAFASSQRMVYLIADLLNVSRLKTGKFVIEPKETYLPDLVEEEINQLKPTARSRKLTINYAKPSRFPKVWLDETKIRQVMMNFIDNAIYYTKAGGTIDVKLIARPKEIEYSVTDDGIGVPKEMQPKLFSKFFRANNARKARPDGTGLGLYMAQRVVSAQGGSVIFESEEGKGSTFGFRFPLTSIKTKQKLLSRSKAKVRPPEPVSV